MSGRLRALPGILLRLCMWLVLATTALVLLTLACWWLIPDEELDPGVTALLAPRVAPPAAENGYFVAWGLRASPDLDPHQVGRAMVAEHECRLAAGNSSPSCDIDSQLGPARLPRSSLEPCLADEKACLSYHRSKAAQVMAEAKRHAVQLARYRSIRNFPSYSQRDVSWNAASPVPEIDLMRMSDLVDAGLALQVQLPATRHAALRELQGEIGLWRRILVDSDTLIAQMVATAALQRKYALASEIMRVYPEVVRDHGDVMADITRPLPANRVNLVRALDDEFRQVIAPLLMDIRKGLDETGFDYVGNFALAGAFKRNATLNAFYRTLIAQRELHSQSAGRILARHRPQDRELHFLDLPGFWRPATLFYNPAGKFLLAEAEQYDLGDYGLRLHDLVAMSRIVELQRRVAGAGVAAQERQSFIASLPELFNPYTERPFDLDPQKSEIRFRRHDLRSRGAMLSVRL